MIKSLLNSYAVLGIDLVKGIAALLISFVLLVVASKIKKIDGKRWLVITLTFFSVSVIIQEVMFFIDIYTGISGIELQGSLNGWYECTQLLHHWMILSGLLYILTYRGLIREEIETEAILFTLKGRVTRTVYGVISTGLYIVFLLMTHVIVELDMTGATGEIVCVVLYGISVLLISWFIFSLSIKRIHDCGKKGSIAVVTLIPLVNIFFIALLGYLNPSPGPNDFGSDPRGQRRYRI